MDLRLTHVSTLKGDVKVAGCAYAFPAEGLRKVATHHKLSGERESKAVKGQRESIQQV